MLRFENFISAATIQKVSHALRASVMLLAYGCQSDLVDQLNSAGASAREPVDHVDAGAPSDRDAGPAGSEPVAQDDDAGATNGPNPTVRVCRPGTFVTEDSTVAEVRCEGCPSGTYSTEEDADQCQQWTECQPGEFVKNKGSATKDQTCEACAGDQTSTAVNAGTCLPVDACPSGTVQVSAAQDGGTAQCEPCDSGSYCAGGTTPAHPCAEGSWDHDEDPATDCVEQTNCPEGQYVTDPGDATSDRSCKDCAKGSFSLSTNATECVAQVECPEGTFRESDGTSAGDVICTACPAGTYTDAADLAECAPWTECPPGQYVSVDGSATADRVCEPCADGEFSSTPNAASCMADGECMPGTRQTEAGTPDRASVCEDCVPGEYCAGADTPAEGCAASTWDHDQDPSTPCVEQTTCLAGSYLVAMGDATTDLTCGPCEDGSFSVDENVLACQSWQVCPEGTYVQTLGSATSDVGGARGAAGAIAALPRAARSGGISDSPPGPELLPTGSVRPDCGYGQQRPRVCDVPRRTVQFQHQRRHVRGRRPMRAGNGRDRACDAELPGTVRRLLPGQLLRWRSSHRGRVRREQLGRRSRSGHALHLQDHVRARAVRCRRRQYDHGPVLHGLRLWQVQRDSECCELPELADLRRRKVRPDCGQQYRRSRVYDVCLGHIFNDSERRQLHDLVDLHSAHLPHDEQPERDDRPAVRCLYRAPGDQHEQRNDLPRACFPDERRHRGDGGGELYRLRPELVVAHLEQRRRQRHLGWHRDAVAGLVVPVGPQRRGDQFFPTALLQHHLHDHGHLLRVHPR